MTQAFYVGRPLPGDLASRRLQPAQPGPAVGYVLADSRLAIAGTVVATNAAQHLSVVRTDGRLRLVPGADRMPCAAR